MQDYKVVDGIKSFNLASQYQVSWTAATLMRLSEASASTGTAVAVAV